jgi:tRNA uridine 5-carboxymethylaminomethyl modification enzyme
MLPMKRENLDPDVMSQVQIMCKYEGYIAREQEQIRRSRSFEEQAIPIDFDYKLITALRREAMEKLDRIRPENLGQASRISGVNPSDVAILSVWLKRMAMAGSAPMT